MAYKYTLEILAGIAIVAFCAIVPVHERDNERG